MLQSPPTNPLVEKDNFNWPTYVIPIIYFALLLITHIRKALRVPYSAIELQMSTMINAGTEEAAL